jgi:hypothetical protein
METLTLTPGSIIHSEHAEPRRTPIQPVCAQGSAGQTFARGSAYPAVSAPAGAGKSRSQ